MEEGLCPPALRLPRSHASTASRTVFVGGRGERTEREAADRSGPIEYARSAPEQVAERMETAQSDGRGTDEWPVRADRWAELIERVRRREPIARAVRHVAREWAGPSDHVNL